MIKKEVNEKNYTKAYIITVILLTWLATISLFINPSTGLKYFSLVMFIPAISAVVFNLIGHRSLKEQLGCFTRRLNLKSVAFGILYPIIFIVVCAFILCITGAAKLNPNHEDISVVKEIIIIIVTVLVNSVLGVLGEEYGWRGYLLPELTKSKGKIKATIIVGIVWALFHVPAVFLLAKTTGIANPFAICIIQAAVVIIFSFPFSYCYYLSGNLIPVLLFHSIWDVVNTTILGNIYVNKPGMVVGKLLYINGEGVTGFILGVVLVYWFIKQFKKCNDKNFLEF
ncbi:MAG: type II CAAX endopeptidase family protein [Bacillota bacterium]|nr:type II CAAX endopeptidase family protein [Bacillota bacterium]